ncbi:rap guanine nucleotide exchange factor 1-like isoform X2 [Chaetodon auriga]|uniref:rap guanine nucleotide exchange factor 1-like isoform X2 n=1 Tax=Chaetodon auriga TaxID=39042 RepID=UPI004033056C
MSSRAESKTASQFVSLTMKLKDKLHPQRIRRSERIKHTPSQRVKPPDLNLHEPSQCKLACVLADQQRAVVSSLQYFKALVDRLLADKMVLNLSVVGGLLGGASSGVLEAVQTLVQLEPHLHNSKTVSSCLARLYHSVAQLIRWADQVMLQGVVPDNKESTASVTTVIRAVLDGVKELVRLAAERQDGPSPLSPVQSQSGIGQPGAFDNLQTSDRTSTCQSPGGAAKKEAEKEEEEEEEVVRTERRGEDQMVLVPPKPPIPVPEVPPLPVMRPPALPPKKRQSSSGPTPCRIAVVAPMRREAEVNSQEDCLKHGLSSADSAAENTHCEEDPDYDFLHTDLSSSETLPLLPHPSSLPPALPEKRRRSAAGAINSEASPSFGFDPAPREDSPTHSDDVIGPVELLSSPLSPSRTPPPLPEKKRHIHQYLQFCSSYRDQSAAMFYQRPLTSSQRHSSKQREVEPNYQPTQSHLDTHLDFAPSPELPSVPVLPPKKRQQDSAEAETDVQCSEEKLTSDSSQSLQQEVEHCHNSREQLEEDVEEVLLSDQKEILHRITMKPEEEEGPDVKAASPDILLVYAAETDSVDEQGLYREAFLSTYRSFISPNAVIRKLQRRYRHLCEGGETEHLEAAKRTFHLLVTVVDELCAIELDSDLLLLLMDLVFSLLTGGELGLAHLLRSNILCKMEQRWQLIGSPQSLRPLAARGVAARPGTLLDFRSQDLAEQLTLLDSELFYKIELPEVLLWSKEQNEEKSPNLTQFTQHFNNVSFWVRSVIILQDKPQDREKLLLKFLKTMKHLRKLNNFNSYLSILSALDSAPLRRLDWQRSTAEALEEYSSLIDSSSSFRAYRAALAEVEPPCIPYLYVYTMYTPPNVPYLCVNTLCTPLHHMYPAFMLHLSHLLLNLSVCLSRGLILQDLTFVHLGNPDMLMTSQSSKVNFSKRWQQFNILDTLRSYQQVSVTWKLLLFSISTSAVLLLHVYSLCKILPESLSPCSRYSLQPNDDIISFFNDFSDHLAEEALWELSLRIRPRNVPRAVQR